jgi:hypothetical protein
MIARCRLRLITSAQEASNCSRPDSNRWQRATPDRRQLTIGTVYAGETIATTRVHTEAITKPVGDINADINRPVLI